MEKGKRDTEEEVGGSRNSWGGGNEREERKRGDEREQKWVGGNERDERKRGVEVNKRR